MRGGVRAICGPFPYAPSLYVPPPCVQAASTAGARGGAPAPRPPLGSLLTNRGLLLTAWFVVMAFLGGALTLAFLQPPPPPTADPVVVAVDFGPAAEPEAPQESGEPPVEEPASAESSAEAESDSLAETQESSESSAETEHTGEAAPPPASSEASAESAAEGAAPEAAEEPGSESGPDSGSEPVTEPAPGSEAEPAVTAPLPPPPPAAEAPPEEMKAEEAAPGEAAPEETLSDAPAEESQQETATAETQPPETGTQESGDELQVAIPVIPPAPEQLPTWERYRQPFNMDDKRPRIAVVMSGLGLSDSATEAAINRLPAAVTLSFSPYARDLERWIALARSRGHEVMIDLPMEPATFPNEDPGPQALLTSLPAEDNLDRLDWVLSRGSAYVGVAGSMGSRFTASRSAMEPILRDVKSRGLIFLDRRTTEDSVVPELAREIGLPRAMNNRSVDERQASRVAIDARLAQIERIALTEGYAVAMAQPYPVTLQRLADWATELTARGFVIAPITALANQQALP